MTDLIHCHLPWHRLDKHCIPDRARPSEDRNEPGYLLGWTLEGLLCDKTRQIHLILHLTLLKRLSFGLELGVDHRDADRRLNLLLSRVLGTSESGRLSTWAGNDPCLDSNEAGSMSRCRVPLVSSTLSGAESNTPKICLKWIRSITISFPV